MNRSLNRGLRISRERIEKDLEKLKKRMNRIYQEVLAREDALKYMDSLTPSEAAEALAKEIDGVPERIDNRSLEQATEELEKDGAK